MQSVTVDNFFPEEFSAILREPQNKILVGESSKLQKYRKARFEAKYGVNRFWEKNQPKIASCTLVQSIVDPEIAFHAIRNTDLLLGLHCDGATEYIVDFALKFNISFAIMPCCTCSKDFPNRKLNGRLVKSYDELVTYLKNQDSRIKEGDKLIPFRKEAK